MRLLTRAHAALFAATTTTLALTASSADTRRQELDHVGAYNFMVEISGVNAGYFKGVDGLNAELEVVEFQDGDDLFLRKRPGRAKFGNITLKRGSIVTQDLQDWWKATRAGKGEARDVKMTIQQFPTKKGKRIKGARVRRVCAYTFHDAKLKALSQKSAGKRKESEAVLVPGKVTHSCQVLFTHPGERRKRAKKK